MRPYDRNSMDIANSSIRRRPALAVKFLLAEQQVIVLR